VKRFPGGAEYSFSAEVELSARIDDKKMWNRPPISMDFQVKVARRAFFTTLNPFVF
jgi:AP-2 complex subunit mu-1